MKFRWRVSTLPPRWARGLLSLFLPRQDRPYALADLDEEFEQRVHRDGRALARSWYWQQVRGSCGPLLRHRLNLGPLGPQRQDELQHLPPDITPPYSSEGEPWMSDFIRDLKYTVRYLLKSPLVLIVTVISLAVGVGATTAVFSLANAFLYRQAGGPAPADLVTIYTSDDEGEPHGRTSFADYEDMTRSLDTVSHLAAFRVGVINLETDGSTQKLMAELVAGDYFGARSIELTLGRGFRAEETTVGSAERVLVLSHWLWQQRFGGDATVLGREVRVDGRPFTIVGVAADGWSSRLLGLEVDVWVPLGVPGGVSRVSPARLQDRSARGLTVLARLAAGAGLPRVQAQLAVLADQLVAEHGPLWRDSRQQPRTLRVLGEADSRVPPSIKAGLKVTSTFLVMAASLLLFLACSNVAGLYLARASQRRRELALRLAIGASRRRLTAMLMLESLLPALLAGVLGLFLALAATRAMEVLPLPIGLPLRFDFSPDWRVLGFAVLLSILASLAFGLAPALEGARTDLTSSLKADSRGGGSGGKVRTRRLLVIGQVATSLIFLAGAGLSMRSLEAAADMEMGIAPDRVAVMSRSLPAERFTAEAGESYYQELLTELRSRPEIEAAHISSNAEITFALGQVELSVAGYERRADEAMAVRFNSVTPGYMEMLDMPLLKGRALNESDVAGAPRVALVSQAFVDRFWPNSSGLGERFEIVEGNSDAAPGSFEVVGVLQDARYSGIDEAIEPFFWTSILQDYSSEVFLKVQGRTSAEEALAVLQQLELFDEEVTILPPIMLDELLDVQFGLQRMVAKVLGYGGLFGLALAALGIAGLIAFTVSQRRRELAIRQALGARRDQIWRSVVNEGLRLTFWGLGLGLIMIVPLARFLETQLFGISPLDLWATGGGCLLLLAATLVACWIPANRATQVDPMTVLREE